MSKSTTYFNFLGTDEILEVVDIFDYLPRTEVNVVNEFNEVKQPDLLGSEIIINKFDLSNIDSFKLIIERGL